jgi:hypothetical protein
MRWELRLKKRLCFKEFRQWILCLEDGDHVAEGLVGVTKQGK